jgi:hypothetical protein
MYSSYSFTWFQRGTPLVLKQHVLQSRTPHDIARPSGFLLVASCVVVDSIANQNQVKLLIELARIVETLQM